MLSKDFFIFTYMYGLPAVYLCTMCTPDAHRIQKTALNPQKPELQMDVNYLVDSGN